MRMKEYFVLYDYGQGGLWAVIYAESAQRIKDRYPQLQVFDHPPETLSSDLIADIRRTSVFDIHDSPAGWLSDLAVRDDADRPT